MAQSYRKVDKYLKGHPKIRKDMPMPIYLVCNFYKVNENLKGLNHLFKQVDAMKL